MLNTIEPCILSHAHTHSTGNNNIEGGFINFYEFASIGIRIMFTNNTDGA